MQRLTKDDLVAFLPHLGDDRLARVENTSESNLDVLECSKLPEDVLARDTERAETLHSVTNVERQRDSLPKWQRPSRKEKRRT